MASAFKGAAAERTRKKVILVMLSPIRNVMLNCTNCGCRKKTGDSVMVAFPQFETYLQRSLLACMTVVF